MTQKNRTSTGRNAAQSSHKQPNEGRSRARGGKPSRPGWLKRKLRRRPLPVWTVVAIDVLAFAVALNLFALFHHVLPRNVEAVGLTSSRESMAQLTPAMTTTAEPTPVASLAPAAAETPSATATPDPVGCFGTKFADKFTDGEVIQNGWDYRSANLNISVTTRTRYSSDVYVCDVYVRDISSFATAFAKDRYGRNYTEDVKKTAKRSNAIVSINGDYYGNSSDGAIIRNGTLYREDSYVDCEICVLYWDGTMKTFPKGKFDARAEMEAGAYQSWAFGPSLLDENGAPKEKFSTGVFKTNPRTAIGYYEPGHYCFVVVDGRSRDSEGVDMAALSYLMDELGCRVAYNLDGGDTSQMLWGTKLINHPSDGGRDCSDIVLIREPA